MYHNNTTRVAIYYILDQAWELPLSSGSQVLDERE